MRNPQVFLVSAMTLVDVGLRITVGVERRHQARVDEAPTGKLYHVIRLLLREATAIGCELLVSLPYRPPSARLSRRSAA